MQFLLFYDSNTSVFTYNGGFMLMAVFGSDVWCLAAGRYLTIFGLYILGSLTIRTKKERLYASVSFFFLSNISVTSSAGS